MAILMLRLIYTNPEIRLIQRLIFEFSKTFFVKNDALNVVNIHYIRSVNI